MIISMLLYGQTLCLYSISQMQYLHNHMHLCVILMIWVEAFSPQCCFNRALGYIMFACELPPVRGTGILKKSSHQSPSWSTAHGIQLGAAATSRRRLCGGNKLNNKDKMLMVEGRVFHVCSHVYYIMPCLGATPLNIHAHVSY